MCGQSTSSNDPSYGTPLNKHARKMLHDPQVYHDPMSFKPERFLSTSGHVPEQDPRVACFGFGRRYVRNDVIASLRTEYIVSLVYVLVGSCSVMHDNLSWIFPSGMNLAEIMVFMVCTMTLALFDIRKVVDENGHEITPTAGHTSGTIRYCHLTGSTRI